MIPITIQIDQTDLDLFLKVSAAAFEKLQRNGVALTREASREIVLSRIFKTGLDEEQRRFVVDRVDDARKLQGLFNATPGRA
jgi:predicted AAA+ superfamily ATPase